MIIERKKENVCQFQGVEEGEVFRLGEEYFMKVENENILGEYDSEVYKVNAIALRTGSFYDFSLNEEVELLTCKLVIE